MKIYVVVFGMWEYEAQNFSRTYFASRKSALRYALSLRREKGDDYDYNEFYELPFDMCYKFPDGRRRVSWSKGDYCGVCISVEEEELLP